MAQPAERPASALDVPRALGRLVGVPQQLLALPRRIVRGQQHVQPQRGIDRLAVESLGVGGRMGEPGEDLGKLAVRVHPLLDQLAEDVEIVVGEGIQHGRVPHLADSALDGALPPHHFTRYLHQDAIAAPASLASQFLDPATHNDRSSDAACAQTPRAGFHPGSRRRCLPTFSCHQGEVRISQ